MQITKTTKLGGGHFCEKSSHKKFLRRIYNLKQLLFTRWNVCVWWGGGATKNAFSFCYINRADLFTRTGNILSYITIFTRSDRISTALYFGFTDNLNLIRWNSSIQLHLIVWLFSLLVKTLAKIRDCHVEIISFPISDVRKKNPQRISKTIYKSRLWFTVFTCIC